ncbi:mitochondrial import inner membrane translocase subunit TIM16 [Blastocladiella emersonii ATCC 22665]|nr:mitochondrial import inner membrane translocase subunit TIM16 [Blastocladiella emersonii ATCC 22665]
MSAPKIIAQVVLTGVQIFGRAFADAYKTAAANAARQRAASGEVGADAGLDGAPVNPSEALNKKLGITLDEAALILNVKKAPLPTKDEILSRYESMFAQNDPAKGGSFYLQSKVFRAKERIDHELKIGEEPEAPAAAEPSAPGAASQQQQQTPPPKA